MADLIGGAGSALSSASNQLTNLVNIFLMVIGFAVIVGFVFATVLLLKKFVFAYKTPVLLKFEVGDNVITKKDKMKVEKSDGRYTVHFRKNRGLVAEVPQDSYSYFQDKGGIAGGKQKAFEGFVRNDQVAWTQPKPMVGSLLETREYTDPKTGLKQQIQLEVPMFVTAPANLLRYHVDRTRRNAELATKLKWWQNPQVMAMGMMSVFLVSVIFIYIMHRSVLAEVQAVIGMTQSLAEKMIAQSVG